ncbi:MAG: ABC transporter ATP-binding protein [bacterium]|nr:ABC transporter ATP-binding protein [bacterium]
MLSIAELSAWYGAVEALHSISLEVHEGERVALVGSNRAGKTTTLRAISGIVQRRAASLTYRGVDLQGLPPHLVPGLGIAHVPEGRQVFSGMSVLENLLVGAYCRRGRDHAAQQERLDFVFSIFPRLAERPMQSGETLSGGEQQMLAIGRALMLSPSLLLLDEPSQGLAPRVVDEMYEALVHVAATGVTILLVEQNISMALEFASRAYVLENGVISLQGSAADLARDDSIRASYLGL